MAKSFSLMSGYVKFWSLLFNGLKLFLGDERVKLLGWIPGGE